MKSAHTARALRFCCTVPILPEMVEWNPVLPYRRRARTFALILAVAVLVACNPPDTPRSRVGKDCRVGIVGDSLMVGADAFGALRDRIAAGGCRVTRFDAQVSRPSSEGAAIVEEWARAGLLPRVVVVSLGTNDCHAATFARSVDRILAAAGPNRPVVWVNTWRAGCDRAINDVLTGVRDDLFTRRRDHGNLWIVDHFGSVTANRSVLASDGVHLSRTGYEQHAARIARVVTG